MGIDRNAALDYATEFENVAGTLDQARQACALVCEHLEREAYGAVSAESDGIRESFTNRLPMYLAALSVIRRDIDVSAEQLNRVTSALYSVAYALPQ